MRHHSRAPGRAWAVAVLLAGGVLVAASGSARALEESPKEKEQLEGCERQLCELLVKRDSGGGDLKCDLSKTWAKDKIKHGIEQKKLAWSLGDARCGLKLEAKRSQIIEALTKPEAEFKLEAHTIKCEVEREKETVAINVSMAPRIQFKDGKATKAWLGVSQIEAPAVVKGAIWTVAQMEDTFGIFHGELIKDVNKFIHEKCPRRLQEAK